MTERGFNREVRQQGLIGLEGDWDGVLRGRGCRPPQIEMPPRPLSINFIDTGAAGGERLIGLEGDRDGVLRGRGCRPPQIEMPPRPFSIFFKDEEIKGRLQRKAGVS